MKKFCLLLLLLISATLFAKTSQTTLPIDFNNSNPAPYGFPSIEISIEGKKLPVILDTGYKKGDVALTTQALQGLHVKYLGTETCATTVTGKTCFKNFIIPELKIGNFVLHDIHGQLMDKLWGGNDDKFKESAASRNGVIGLPLLKNFGVLLDYPNQKVILTENNSLPENYTTQEWMHVPFTLEHGITSQANLDGATVKLVWDTGAIPSVIRGNVVKYLEPEPCLTNLPYYTPQCRRVISTKFIIAEQKLPNTWFILTDIPANAPMDGLIGSNFYERNLVFFNFRDQTVAVKHVE